VIGGGREVEFEAALSLTGAVLPDVTVRAFHLPAEASDWTDDHLGPAEQEPDFVVFPDPFTTDANQLMAWLDERFPASVKIGGLSSGGRSPGDAMLFLDDEVHRSGTVGIALTGNVEVDTIVAQGCRPIGSPMFVTRCDRHLLYQLDGRSAIGVVETLYSRLSPDDQKLFRSSLFLGLVMQDAQEIYEQGDFLIRNLVGVDPDMGALAVAAPLHDGQVVQFHLRDADTSADDLRELLSRHQYASPSGALLFSCLGRGKGLYGEPDHDSGLFEHQMGAVPLGGFFCSGEIGPVHGQTFIHGYTSSFALFRPKRA
jgi:small ligand-binding sensory domain FIST